MTQPSPNVSAAELTIDDCNWNIGLRGFTYTHRGPALRLEVSVWEKSGALVSHGSYTLLYELQTRTVERTGAEPRPDGLAGSQDMTIEVIDVLRRELQARGLWHGIRRLSNLTPIRVIDDWLDLTVGVPTQASMFAHKRYPCPNSEE